MAVVVKVIRIPEELDRKLSEAARRLGVSWESVLIFALIRHLEVTGLLWLVSEGGDKHEG